MIRIFLWRGSLRKIRLLRRKRSSWKYIGMDMVLDRRFWWVRGGA
jgi:hypothetical protein